MGNATKNSGGSSKSPGGHKVIHTTAQTAFVRVISPRPGGCHEYVKGFCTLAHGPLVGLCVCTSRISSLLNLIPLYTFVSKKVISVSYILAVNLIEFAFSTILAL